MDIIQLIPDILLLIILFIGGIWVKNYFPSYMKKKAENLATKEDIKIITKLTEEVQEDFKQRFEVFSKDKEFKYNHYYNQFCKLYTRLYSMVAQSEYTRRFLKLYNGTAMTFEEVPFIEIRKTHTEKNIKLSKDTTITKTETEVKDDITNFCKKSLCNLIIENGEYATQRLLKLAVAYRFAYDNYSGNIKNGDAAQIADEEEFKIIKEILNCIVKDYNFLRKELRLEYIDSELSTGSFENIVLEDKLK